MKKILFTPIAGMMLLLFSSFQIQENIVLVNKEKFCGPSFVITNSAGYSVSKIRVQVSSTTSYSYVINNPSFPYSFSDPGLGTYTFIFYFNGSVSGSINVTTNSGSQVTCEDFQTPYLAPVAFYAGCFVTYTLAIRNFSC